jgi:hypothetical protein
MSSVKSFASIVEEFCAWVARNPMAPEHELDSARRLAAQLYAAALDLPSGGGPYPAKHAGGLEPTREAVFKRFACLPINMYASVDPLVVPGDEPGVGDVADDLTDTYFDLLRGLQLYRLGLHDAAASDWSLSFRTHWGEHVVGALSAMQAYATRV